MNNETKDSVIEIDIRKLIGAYLQKWWLIILCAVVAAAAALTYTANFITPLYRASVTIYVNNISADERVDYISGSNLQASQQLVSTYVNIIRSDMVLAQVVEKSGLNFTPGDIRGMMSAAQVDETEIFTVSISNPNPEMAAKIANAIAAVAPAEIEEIVEGSSTKIIDYAKVPGSRYTPSYTRNTVLGGVIGGLIALIYLTLRCLLDVRIKDSEDLEQLFEYPVLGQIPAFSQTTSSRAKGYYGANSYESASDKADRKEGRA